MIEYFTLLQQASKNYGSKLRQMLFQDISLTFRHYKIMTKHLLLLFIALFLCAASSAAQRRVSNIRSVDFQNFTYTSSVCSKDVGLPNEVKVRRGKFRDKTLYYQIASGKIVYGDLTGDGREEAVVSIICGDTAGNFSNAEIFVYTLQNGRAVLLAKTDNGTLETDYKRQYADGFIVKVNPGLNGVKVANQHLLVEAYTDGSNASPKYVSTLDYRLRSTNLVMTAKPKRRLAKYLSSGKVV